MQQIDQYLYAAANEIASNKHSERNSSRMAGVMVACCERRIPPSEIRNWKYADSNEMMEMCDKHVVQRLIDRGLLVRLRRMCLVVGSPGAERED